MSSNQTLDGSFLARSSLDLFALFLDQFLSSNTRCIDFVRSLYSYDLILYILFGLGTYSTVLLSAYMLSKLSKKYQISLDILLYCAIILLLALPCIVPCKAMRLGCGLHGFAYSMYIFGRMMDSYQSIPNNKSINKSGSESGSPKEKQEKVAGKGFEKGDFGYELFSMLYYYIYPFLTPMSSKTFRNGLIGEIALLVVLFDGVIYLMQELVPYYYTSNPTSLQFYTSLLAGVFFMVCMDLLYKVAEVICTLLGLEIPKHMLHTTPLLSHSVSDFWNNRWNPFICKLLQYCFYKPTVTYLTKMIAERVSKGSIQLVTICTVFVGSSLLHAYPIYIATQNVRDTVHMGMFFVVQILFILAEYLVAKQYRSSTSSINNKASISTGRVTKTAPMSCRTTEFLIILTLLYFCFVCHEQLFTPLHTSLVTVMMSTVLYKVFNLYYTHYKPSTEQRKLTSLILYYMAGWLYTVCTIVSLMPWFSIPMLHALDSLYAKSFVTGPLVRTVDLALQA